MTDYIKYEEVNGDFLPYEFAHRHNYNNQIIIIIIKLKAFILSFLFTLHHY